MNKPERKDLVGMANIFGAGSPDHCIGQGYNEAYDEWEEYHNQEIKKIRQIILEEIEKLDGKHYRILSLESKDVSMLDIRELLGDK